MVEALKLFKNKAAASLENLLGTKHVIIGAGYDSNHKKRQVPVQGPAFLCLTTDWFFFFINNSPLLPFQLK